MHWGSEDEADYQTPKELKWEDGSPATIEDYSKLKAATRTMQIMDEGQHVTVIFPDVTSVTIFDEAKGHWVVKASSGDVLDLLEADPKASDKTLFNEISNNPVIYRTTIDRSHIS